ncbi:hypothetical protein E2C01_029003 [Portunus trituberculatus]|uniref:Uncharacterized protein n=1 Tax=Portunus trituberculatus TaxID=210409 RepID=A0A5B7EQM7_PORTR|nr:hypothetical protein [Portunus trituberculatus]
MNTGNPSRSVEAPAGFGEAPLHVGLMVRLREDSRHVARMLGGVCVVLGVQKSGRARWTCWVLGQPQASPPGENTGLKC